MGQTIKHFIGPAVKFRTDFQSLSSLPHFKHIMYGLLYLLPFPILSDKPITFTQSFSNILSNFGNKFDIAMIMMMMVMGSKTHYI